MKKIESLKDAAIKWREENHEWTQAFHMKRNGEEDGVIELSDILIDFGRYILSDHEKAMREVKSENTKLRELLSEIADDMERDYNNKYQAVIEHNNLDGVGISFDYRSNPKKPKYLQEIRETINKPIA